MEFDFNNTISQLITKLNKMNDDYILKVLKRYKLYTGNQKVYDLLHQKYFDEIDINYSEFLSKEHNLYIFDYRKYENPLQPIYLIYEEPIIDNNPLQCTYTAYSNVHLEAGGERL